VCSKFLVIGTLNGSIHQLDLDGNQVQVFSSHSSTVNQATIDSSLEYISTASDDGSKFILTEGNIVISNLYTPEIQKFNFKAPMRCVSFEPGYVNKPAKQYVAGGSNGAVTLNGKGWFANSQVSIHSGEGPVSSLTWRGVHIIWSTDKGVHVYDISSGTKVGFIELNINSLQTNVGFIELNMNSLRCNICWKSDYIFFIGWANNFKAVEIKEKQLGKSAKELVVIHQFESNLVISGLAPFKDSVIILGCLSCVDDYKNANITIRKDPVIPEVHLLPMDEIDEHCANQTIKVRGCLL
jgi:WD40 repeat protein